MSTYSQNWDGVTPPAPPLRLERHRGVHDHGHVLGRHHADVLAQRAPVQLRHECLHQRDVRRGDGWRQRQRHGPGQRRLVPARHPQGPLGGHRAGQLRDAGLQLDQLLRRLARPGRDRVRDLDRRQRHADEHRHDHHLGHAGDAGLVHDRAHLQRHFLRARDHARLGWLLPELLRGLAGHGGHGRHGDQLGHLRGRVRRALCRQRPRQRLGLQRRLRHDPQLRGIRIALCPR